MPSAKTSASRRYNEKAYDRIEFTIPKGGKAEIIAAAKASSMSVNAFVKTAINEKIARSAKKE
ncbi:MAG: antitoxin [Oscillospiraceae bacterium]|nr:antitoxin [Oscillospiraceae bacterium]